MKINPDDGVGLEWVGKNGDKYKSLPRKDYRRKIKIKISSWVGTCSLGAMHYYGRVEIPSLNASCNGSGEFGGYLGGTEPKEIDGIDFQAERKLMRVERDMNDDIIGKIGEMTTRFNDEKSAGLASLKLAADNFEGDWVVSFEDVDGGDYEFPLSELEVSENFLEKCKEECRKCFDE